jgi:hypothetical protein
MKKLFPVILVGLLLFSGIGLPASSSHYDFLDDQQSKKIEEYSFNQEFNIQCSEKFVSLSFDVESGFLSIPGQPLLPKVTKVFTFPIGTKIKDIDIEYNTKEFNLPKKIQPAPQPIPKDKYFSSKILSEKPMFDNEFYESEQIFPSSPYTIRKGVGLDNQNQHVIYLKIEYYTQYIPAHDVVIIPEEVNVTVTYESSTCSFLGAEEYDLLIITDEFFKEDLLPLVNHKNKVDMITKLETVQNILPQYEGRDDAEDVKLFIRDAIEKWGIRYVLLAGGRKGQSFEWYVPSRRSNNGGSNWESGYESDLYFADIYKMVENNIVFDDWDSNGNDIFAEWSYFSDKRDTMDYYPDVHIGRLPFRYPFEVKPVVSKIIDYENNANDAWFKDAVVVAGDTFPPFRGAPMDHVYEGEVVTNLTATLLEDIGFDVQKLWLSLDAWKSSEDVITMLNQGSGFVHFAGHGNPSSWGNHPPDITENIFYDGLSVFDMKEFKNDGKLPITVVGGCHNAQFNVTIRNIPKIISQYGFLGSFFVNPFRFFYMDWVPRDFCSWLVLQRNGGAIASIGNTGLGYGSIGEYGDFDLDNIVEPDCLETYGGWIETRFFDAYSNQQLSILGETRDQAIIDYINIIGNVGAYPEVGYINDDAIGRQTIEEWTLIGDPSLQIGGSK